MTRGHGRAVPPSREVTASYLRLLARTLAALALVTVSAGAPAVTSAAKGGQGANPSAADPQHLTIVNQPAWFADADPRTGTVTQPVAVFTPEACPAGTTRHKTSVVAVRAARPADQAAADRWPAWGNLYSPVSADLPGPLLAYPAAMSWSTMAGLHGLTVVPGTYELVTRCQDALGQRVLKEWRGAVVFDSATSYHVPAPYATTLGRSAMATRTAPSPGPSATAAPEPSTSAGPLPTPSPAGSTSGGAGAPRAPSADETDGAAVVAGATPDESSAGSGNGWATIAFAVIVGALLLSGGVVVAARRGRDG